jgi:hypothetical protein
MCQIIEYNYERWLRYLPPIKNLDELLRQEQRFQAEIEETYRWAVNPDRHPERHDYENGS